MMRAHSVLTELAVVDLLIERRTFAGIKIDPLIATAVAPEHLARRESAARGLGEDSRKCSRV